MATIGPAVLEYHDSLYFKIHLAKCSDGSFVTALIYPAEYDDEFSRWLIDGEYKTAGQAEGGVSAVQTYYDNGAEILRRYQVLGQQAHSSKTGAKLFAAAKTAVQR